MRHADGLVRLELPAVFRLFRWARNSSVSPPSSAISKRGRGQLAAPVDADIDQILGVELEVEPGAAIRNHPRGEEVLARRMGLAPVVIEENARAERCIWLTMTRSVPLIDEGAVLASSGACRPCRRPAP